MTATIARLADNLLQRLVPRAEAAAACNSCPGGCYLQCCVLGARPTWVQCCPKVGGSGCTCTTRGDC
ncbi:hypothetical protein [Nonomuraea sp. NPDC005650]|uniref:hypothetical protein n=1 Tax=Nonomuraea sp. NPDC005650 TaxID=3157045 RepID=UPI0033BD7AD4